MIKADDLEVKREAVVNAVNVRDSPDGTSRLIVYFSDWRRLKVAVAWYLKLKRMLLNKVHRRRESESSSSATTDNAIALKRQALTVEDLYESELAIIRYCQQQRFSEEIATLSAGKGAVSRQSSLYKLELAGD